MKNKFKKALPWLILFGLISVVFKNWFTFAEISAGDAPFHFKEDLKEILPFPFIWSTRSLGLLDGPLHAFSYLILPVKILSVLNIPWEIIERLIWYWPFLILTVFSSRFLTRIVFPDLKFNFLAPFIYLTNSYILMIIGGGQISIALSYAVAPLVIGLFIKNIEKINFRRFLVSGLVLALQVSFEPRIASLTMVIAFFYALLKYKVNPLGYIMTFFLPIAIVVGSHFYWILPLLSVRKAAYNLSLSSSDWVSFLSFAQFSQSFSLLHPLWPENIFGKSHFMKPEFLVIPILAYLSLFFVSSKVKSQKSKLQLKTQNFNILFFAFLGLLGAFLAKGSTPPFGEVYSWLFKNFPGINLFRDPTKFYTLVALSYSVLIPYSVSNIYEWIKSQNKFSILNFPVFVKAASFAGVATKAESAGKQNYLALLFVLLVVTYWLFSIRPAWMGELGGTFKAREAPEEDVALKDFLSSQPEFFRTLWVPQRHHFGFYSNTHPFLNSLEFVSPNICQPPLCELADQSKKPPEFNPTVTPETEILAKVRDYSLSYFSHPDASKILAKMGVKYVIVPSDSEGEIFLRDRKYSQEEKEKYLAVLNNVPWLKRLNVGDKLVVYETLEHRDHFFAVGEEPPAVKWRMVNSTKYEIEVKNATQPFTMVFSETYDTLWQAKIKGEIIPSKIIYGAFNSFQLDKKGNVDLTIEFAAQKYVWWGGAISLLTLTTSIFLLLRKR